MKTAISTTSPLVSALSLNLLALALLVITCLAGLGR